MTAVEDTAVSTAETERVAMDDEGRPSLALFVSSALDTWATANPEWFARDVQINDTVYRRLDSEYYAWLRSRMVVAKRTAAAGKLDATAFEDLRVRFNGVHEWAIEHFGEERLLEAVWTRRAADYQPPVTEDDDPRVPAPRSRDSNHMSRQNKSPWWTRSANAHYLWAGSMSGSTALAAVAYSIRGAGLSAI